MRRLNNCSLPHTQVYSKFLPAVRLALVNVGYYSDPDIHDFLQLKPVVRSFVTRQRYVQSCLQQLLPLFYSIL